jgi:hypothetical protein
LSAPNRDVRILLFLCYVPNSGFLAHSRRAFRACERLGMTSYKLKKSKRHG